MMQEIMAIHEHDRTEDRLVHHWIGAAPVGEEWRVQGAVASIIAAAIPGFIQEMRLKVHAFSGIRGDPARNRYIQCGEQDLCVPRDGMFFLENVDILKERFVLKVETDFAGDIEIAVFAKNPAE
jgi:hypothetical protein